MRKAPIYSRSWQNPPQNSDLHHQIPTKINDSIDHRAKEKQRWVYRTTKLQLTRRQTLLTLASAISPARKNSISSLRNFSSSFSYSSYYLFILVFIWLISSPCFGYFVLIVFSCSRVLIHPIFVCSLHFLLTELLLI